MISAILVAAGESKRMGELKQLMPFRKSTILEQTIDNLLNSTVNEIILVLGFKAEEITKIIAAKSIEIALNPDYQEGMSTSIIKGLDLVDDRTEAIMLALADQPFIDSKIIDRLIQQFYAHDKGIVIPAYRGKRGHPVIFAAKYKTELRRLTGDTGGRQIIEEHLDDILEITVDSPGINIDIDTMSNYRSYIR